MPYPDELRTIESLARDRQALPGPDGDPRPLEEPMDSGLAAELDEQRGLQIEQRLRDRDRAGV